MGHVAASAALLAAGPALARPKPLPPHSAANLEVEALPLQHFDLRDRVMRRFGALQFLSGMVLRCANPAFGGFSSLRVRPNGADFLSASDVGDWFEGRITYDAQGRMAGIADARIAPMLGPLGRQLRETGQWDTECIAEGPAGVLHVGIERVNEILRFDFGRDGTKARGQPVAVPPSVTRLPDNKGLEALGVMPAASPFAGALIGIAERAYGHTDSTLGVLIGGPRPGDFTVARQDDFDVSDLAFLPGGDLLILERRFNWRSGVAIRIRRVTLGDIGPGARIAGRLILDADMGHEIDNLEGLSVHRGAAGDTILTLISDDNFSWLQRTLMLQFALIDD